MNKTDKLNRAVDDAMDQVAAALESVKAQAISTADEIGQEREEACIPHRERLRKLGATPHPALKSSRSRVESYLQEQPLHTIALALATGFLLSLVLLFFRLNRTEKPTLKQTAPLR